MKFNVGIDLGGSSAKVAVINDQIKVVKAASVITAGRPTPRDVVNRIYNATLPLIQDKTIQQIGVGVAGDIDFKNGFIRVSPNLGWKNVPLRSLFYKAYKKRVLVDNDANVAAWGVYKTQVSNRIKHFMVVTLGTGVGGGIILNGRLHRGATGTAGEVGHMTMVDNGRLCNCGNLGCLETYAGGAYLTREVRRRLESGEQSSLRKIFESDPDQLNPYVIAQAAKQGDEFARGIWEEAGHILGIALGNLIYVFNPELIYLTGGVAQAKELITGPIKKSLKKRSFKEPIKAVKIKIAERAARIGVIGASLLTK